MGQACPASGMDVPSSGNTPHHPCFPILKLTRLGDSGLVTASFPQQLRALRSRPCHYLPAPRCWHMVDAQHTLVGRVDPTVVRPAVGEHRARLGEM